MHPAASTVSSTALTHDFLAAPLSPGHFGDSGRNSARQERRTREVEGEIVAALLASGHPMLGFIACEVEHDRVVLRGRVRSYHLKQLAQEHAQRVNGVRCVDNQLEVLGRAFA